MPVAVLVPVVSPTSEISGIYLFWGEARAHGGGIKSWVVIGRPGLEDHMESNTAVYTLLTRLWVTHILEHCENAQWKVNCQYLTKLDLY